MLAAGPKLALLKSLILCCYDATPHAKTKYIAHRRSNSLPILVKIVQGRLAQLAPNAKSGCLTPFQPKMLAKSRTLAVIQDHQAEMQQMRY